MTRRRLLGSAPDVVLVVLLFAAAFVVHDTAYVLRVPYWLDESWVAVSTKVHLGDVQTTGSITPFGWTLLLRAAFVGGEQRARIVPLVFAGLTAAAAYWLGRELRLGRLASTGLGVVALLAPVSLIRNDLKQYTAEAASAITVAALVARVDRRRDRRSLLLLGVGLLLLLTVASTTLFTGAAAFAALGLAAVARRSWTSLRDLVVTGAVVGVGWAGWLLGVIEPSRSAGLTDYFAAYYPPRTAHGALTYVSDHLHLVAGIGGAGMHSATVLVALLLLAVVVLAVSGQVAVALLPLLASAAVLVAGLAHAYPVLDVRTSTWLLTLVPVLTYAGIGRLLAGGVLRRWSPPRVVAAAGSALALLAVLPYAWGSHGYVRGRSIPFEDTRSQAQVVLAERRPGDVVVVDQGANWGFAFYGGTPAPLGVQTSPLVANQYFVVYPDPLDVALHGRDPATVQQAWTSARAKAAATPGARIWLVRAHMPGPEAAEWTSLLAGAHVLASYPSGLVEVGT